MNVLTSPDMGSCSLKTQDGPHTVGVSAVALFGWNMEARKDGRFSE